MQMAIWDEARNISKTLGSTCYPSELMKKVKQRKWNLVWYTIIHLNIHATKYTIANITCLAVSGRLHKTIRVF